MSTKPLFVHKLAPIRKRITNGLITATSSRLTITTGTDAIILYTVPAGYQLRIQRIDVKVAGTSAAPTAALVRFWETEGAGNAMFDELAITTTPVPSDSTASQKASIVYTDGHYLDAGEILSASATVINATGNQYVIVVTAGLVELQ